MKKNKRKIKHSIGKSAILAIEGQIVMALTAVTTELGQDSKKLKKEILKRSAQIAKKLSKKIKITLVPIEITEEEPAVTPV